jgi:predicted RNase H-like HicB family nuclease
MIGELTAIVKREGDWWIGWIEEIPGANAQERTKEELLNSLREAAQDILAIHRETALRQADKDFEEISLAI